MKRIIYVTKISKSGIKVYIVVPKKYHSDIEHGKTYRVIIEGPLEEMDP